MNTPVLDTVIRPLNPDVVLDLAHARAVAFVKATGLPREDIPEILNAELGKLGWRWLGTAVVPAIPFTSDDSPLRNLLASLAHADAWDGFYPPDDE